MPRKKRPQTTKRQFLPWGTGLFIIVLFFDQYTKHMIAEYFPLGAGKQVFSWLWLTYVQNTGVLWGQLQGANTALIWISLLAFGLLLYFHDEFETTVEKVCYTLLLVGLWGNLLDRVFRGFVVDFIDLGWFPVFNIADSAICVAITVYLLEQWRKSQNSSKSSN